MYLLIVLGLGVYLWPTLIKPGARWELMEGIRYPLQMLPVLLWEVLWKTPWLLLVPLPQGLSNYMKGRGDRWFMRSGKAGAVTGRLPG